MQASSRISGAILIDKPSSMTSYDVVREIKRAVPGCKIGHTGTLDPLATGLMILLMGTSTKLADRFLKLNKVYSFTVRLGQETDTMDSTGTIVKECDYGSVTEDALKAAALALRGDIEQRPPLYSAIKYKRRPLYAYARSGQEVAVTPRTVHIRDISIDSFSPPYAVLTAEVSSGTYIRSLAKSIGDGIGCGAHVTALRRLSIGDFSVRQAYRLDHAVRCLQQGPVDLVRKSVTLSPGLSAMDVEFIVLPPP